MRRLEFWRSSSEVQNELRVRSESLMRALLGALATLLLLAPASHAAISVYASIDDSGLTSEPTPVVGAARVHVYFSNGTTPATVPANRCTASSDGDEICQWAVKFQTTGDLIIADVGWNGTPIEDNEPTSPAAARSGTGGNAVTGELGPTKLATLSIIGTNGTLELDTPGGFGFVLPDGTLETLISPIEISVSSAQPWKGVSTLDDSACASMGSGELRCWWGTGFSVGSGSYRQVATAPAGACAIDFNDAITCWGGVGSPPSTHYVQLAAGYDNHMCGLLKNGDIECWGVAAPWLTPATYFGPYQMVSRGDDFACAITLEGAIDCFGVVAGITPPATVGFVDLAGGTDHLCGLLSDRSVECWGSDASGQVTGSKDPGIAGADSYDYTEISAGISHSCGIYTARTMAGEIVETGGTLYKDQVWCWGDGSGGKKSVPAGSYSLLSLNDEGGCGLTTDEDIQCWGTGSADPADVFYPLPAAGLEHSCRIETDNSLTCWGVDGAETKVSTTPGAGTFVQVDANETFSCAIEDGGTLNCWGSTPSGAPTSPPATFTQVVTGTTHACALEPDATVTCWGTGAGAVNPTPDGSFLFLAAGMTHTCGIKADLSLDCWGESADSRGAHPSTFTYQSLKVGDKYGCARRVTGQVDCWGTGLGSASEPPGSFDDLAGGGYSICGTRKSGDPDCWSDFLPSVPEPRKEFATIAAGGEAGTSSGVDHTCGPTTNGGTVCWGGAAATSMTSPTDSDLDGYDDSEDSCPGTPNGPALGTCFGGTDDGSACPPAACAGGGVCQTNQEDADFDRIGDVCDLCVDTEDETNADRDLDGTGDICDTCPDIANGPDAGICVVVTGGPELGDACTSDSDCDAGTAGSCELSQDGALCAPLFLFAESDTTPAAFFGGGGAMAMSGGAPTPGDYTLRLACPSNVDVGELNVGMILPSESVSGTGDFCGNSGLCSPHAIDFDLTTNLIDDTHRYFFHPGQISGTDPLTVFLSLKSKSADGFCAGTTPGQILDLVQLDVADVPIGAHIDFATFDFQAVETWVASNAPPGDDFDVAPFEEVDGTVLLDQQWLYAGPESDLNLALRRGPAESGREWVIELLSSVDVSNIGFTLLIPGSDFSNSEYDDGTGAVLADKVRISGCVNGDGMNNDPPWTCTANSATAKNGFGATVHPGNSDVDLHPTDNDRLLVTFNGNIEGGTKLVEIDEIDPDGLKKERVLIATITMPDATIIPVIDRNDANGFIFDAYDPVSQVNLSQSQAQTSDFDEDSVSSDADNCPRSFNPLQIDRGGFLVGGIGTPERNGTGDVCECGEADGDGAIYQADVDTLQAFLSGSVTNPDVQDRCSVVGDALGSTATTADCNIKDVVLLQLALDTSDPSFVKPICTSKQPGQALD